MTDHGIETDVVPESMREREQWLCWKTEQRDGKATKIPVTPETGGFASATDPNTWGTFETALSYVEAGNADGIGFVFTDGWTDPFVGVDLDGCRDPETGEPNDRARDIIRSLDSYTEVSPSGTGYHIIVKGELPEGRNRRGEIELYNSARFFTVTGDHVGGTPTTVARRQVELVEIHEEYVADEDDDEEPIEVDVEIDMEDEELLEKAKSASNGEKFERLWKGHTGGYESQSEADMALCCLLAFWTGGERSQMDQLFRRSDLYRAKWDKAHYSDGTTYGRQTIERAIAKTSDFYDPGPAPTDDEGPNDD